MKRIGIFGGSFSPPHKGHFRAISAFLASEEPDEMLVIPAHTPPHKMLKGDASPADRMEMCRIAFSELPVTISDMELLRGGTSYTVLTLRELKREDKCLILLCGTDMFLTLDTWYSAREIFSLAEIVYMRREEDADAVRDALAATAARYRRDYGATVREILCDPLEISSTDIRRMLAENEPTDRYLDARVREYIDRCNLYRT